MPTEHTPGPWKRCERGDYSDFDGNSVVIVGRNDCCRVAVVHHEGHEEDEANARLISAAPELIETLREIVSLTKESVLPNPVQVHAKACAAIAKAEGRK